MQAARLQDHSASGGTRFAAVEPVLPCDASAVGGWVTQREVGDGVTPGTITTEAARVAGLNGDQVAEVHCELGEDGIVKRQSWRSEANRGETVRGELVELLNLSVDATRSHRTEHTADDEGASVSLVTVPTRALAWRRFDA